MGSTETMLEKCARAAAKTEYDEGAVMTDLYANAEEFAAQKWEAYVPVTLAVLDALETPTPEMIEAGRTVVNHYDLEGEMCSPAGVYRAMIIKAKGTDK